MASSLPPLLKSTGSPGLLKARLSLLLMLLLLLLPSGGDASFCEELNASFCQGLGYNSTMFPNTLNHTTHDEAELAMRTLARWNLHTFHPGSECHERERRLICLAFFPPCTVLGLAVPPCREACESVLDSCVHDDTWVAHPALDPALAAAIESSAPVSGIWPEKCEMFPENTSLCLSIDWPSASTTETPTFAGNMSWTNTSWLSADSGSSQMSGNATFLPEPTWNFNFTDSLPMSTGRPSMSTTNVPDLGPFQAFWSALSQAGAVEGGSAEEMPVQVIAMMAEMFARFGRIQQLQEEKLGLEIRLLRRELRRG